MINKGTKLYSIVHFSCPRCQESPLFVNPNPYVYNDMAKIYENCPVCGNKHEIEPGFFWGAMYVSYAFSVAISVTVFLIYHVLFSSFPFSYFVVALILAQLLSYPVFFRLSRVIYLNFFINYKADAAQKKS